MVVEVEAEDIAVEVAEVMLELVAAAVAAIVRMFRGLTAGRPAFVPREVGSGLDPQPDREEAWVEDSVPNNARPRVRVEDRAAAAEGRAVEAQAACRAWAAVGKGLLSVPISIAPGLVPVPVQVKARALAFVRAKGLAREVALQPAQVRDRAAVTISLVFNHRDPAAVLVRFAQAKVVAVFLAVPVEEIALVEVAAPAQARTARAKAAGEFLVARAEETVLVPVQIVQAAVDDLVEEDVRAVIIGLGGLIARVKAEAANNGDRAAAEIDPAGGQAIGLIGPTIGPTDQIARIAHRAQTGPTVGRTFKTTITTGGISGVKTTALTLTTSRTIGSTTGLTLTNTGISPVGPVVTTRASSGIGVTKYSTIAGIGPRRFGTVAKTTGIMYSMITGGARLGGIPARPSRSA